MTAAARLPRASEADCQATIVAAALAAGWRVHAERAAGRADGSWRTAVQGNVGFPDLVLVRRSLLLVVELKRHPNRVEPEQAAWIHELWKAGTSVAVWWVPEELDPVLAWLVARAPTAPPPGIYAGRDSDLRRGGNRATVLS